MAACRYGKGRYPLKMLPLLFFEIIWKSIWLAAFALPLLLTHSYIDVAMAEKIQACLTVVIILPLIPWHYVFSAFASHPGGDSADSSTTSTNHPQCPSVSELDAKLSL